MAWQSKKISVALRVTLRFLLLLAAVYAAAIVGIILWAFEAKLQKWPILVFGQPYCVKVGEEPSEIRLLERLSRLGYTSSPDRVPEPGQWSQSGSSLYINLKYCPLQGEGIASGPVAISLDWNRISSIRLEQSSGKADKLILEPELIGIIPPDGQAQEICRPVPLDKVPALLVDAVLLTEDRRFYSHFGIDVASIHRALKTNIKAWRYVEGASTVTQQLIRMTLLNPEKTLVRKINEIFLAIAADAIYSKETILQAYLNRCYFGHWGPFPIKGVAEASYLLFGKDLSELDPAECALIAATIRAPNIINPFRHPERARKRRNMILGLLFKEGKISRDTYEKCLESPLTMKRPGALPVRAETFIGMVADRLPGYLARRGAPADVVTTMEPLLQAEADNQLRQLGEAGQQACLVICNPQTGSIRALLAPAAAKWSPSGVNLESLLPLVATPALVPGKQDMMRFTLTSRMFGQEPMSEPVTFRQAFEKHRTALIKRLVAAVGSDAIVQTLEGFGVAAEPDGEYGITVAPMTPLEMTRSYSLLATLGNAAPLDPGVRVAGTSLPAGVQSSCSVTADAAAMFMVNHLMKGLIPATGKYGSADRSWLHPSVFLAKDRGGLWGVAYRTDALLLLRLPGSQLNEKHIRTLMTRLLPAPEQGYRGRESPPDGIIFRKICVRSGLLATSTCPQVIREPFFKGTQPTEWCPLRHEPEK